MSTILDENEIGDIIQLTEELIRTPSSVHDGNSIYEFTHGFLKKQGFEPEYQKIKNPYLEYSDFRNLYLRLGNGRGPKILLNCHLDTVEACEGWMEDPYNPRLEDGKLYGLGAADMKGGCAAAIYSMVALASRKKTINGEIFLSCVFGEEAPFSLGTDTLLREHDFSGYDLAIVTEPSPLLAINDFCFDHRRIHKSKFPVVIIGAEGRILMDIEFMGRSAHASHPSQGINALHDASRLITKLSDFDMYSNIKMGRGHYCVLNIEGGDRSFTVPSHCLIQVNRQITLGETKEGCIKELKSIVRRLRLRSKVKISPALTPCPEVEYSPYLCDKSEWIDRFMKVLPKPKRGKRCRFTTSSVGDFNLLGHRTRVPTLVIGPGGGNIHAPNEFVNVDEVVKTTEYLLDFFGEVF